MAERVIRLATRGSALALWQARYVKGRLEEAHGGLRVEILVVKTSGDRIQDRPLLEVGGKGLFVKEIQTALLAGEADLAIHSLKDYPAENPEALCLACVPAREDPRDALVLPPGRTPADLPGDAIVGTGSLRRAHQVRRLFPSWRLQGIRGNVETRLRKVDGGEIDGAVLACAGLKRLGFGSRITRPFTEDEVVPAVGQGALAVEGRRGDREVLSLAEALEDPKARLCVEAERRFLRGLGGSCTTPLGIHATLAGERMVLRGFLATVAGDRWIAHRVEGPAAEAPRLADRLLEAFERRGAGALLAGG
ncbi:MAG: hydroxymethylbilane synthase [Acidobacteriota bacterium]